MVKERLKLEPEVEKVFQCIDNGRNFLLSGGAGSGKTYSLVQVIRQVIAENPTSKVACMTYTNAAVKEIESRVNHKNLQVSTIHDFLWDNIKHFQKELKSALIVLANDDQVTQIVIEGDGNVPDNYFDSLEEGIQYKEYLKLNKGIISHDELIIVAHYLFDKFPKLSDIVKDRYGFIFVDEYQDTSKAVVEVFLNHFQKSRKKNIVGFFGDSMQAIYDDVIGDLDEHKGDEADKVCEIKKAQNRRNPQKIIELANRLRTDGIRQVPSGDQTAPNMSGGQVKEGDILFIHSTNQDISVVKKFLSEVHKWDFSDIKQTKELNLTHNLIADKAGFPALMEIYDKDYILDYKNRVKSYIKKKGITADFSEKTFGEVIGLLEQGTNEKELKDIKPTKTMQAFIDQNKALYDIALNYKYIDFVKIYVSKDQLLDDKKQDEDDENKKGSKRDKLIKHLFKIQTNISFYKQGQFNEFLRATDYRHRIISIEHKKTLKENIEAIVEVGDKTIEEVINDAHEKGICLIDDALNEFKDQNKYLYSRVKEVKFREFQKLYDYLEGKTPFSTQHKTKGTEFNNVLVVLDNGGWNKYNFESLFLNEGTETVLKRTQKIFYVCCTRAKESLAVFYHSPSTAVIKKAKEWFGEKNVVSLDV